MAEEDRIIKTLRAQAWERAKGELGALLNTFYPAASFPENSRPGQFEELDRLVAQFIRKVEGSGLEE